MVKIRPCSLLPLPRSSGHWILGPLAPDNLFCPHPMLMCYTITKKEILQAKDKQFVISMTFWVPPPLTLLLFTNKNHVGGNNAVWLTRRKIERLFGDPWPHFVIYQSFNLTVTRWSFLNLKYIVPRGHCKGTYVLLWRVGALKADMTV